MDTTVLKKLSQMRFYGMQHAYKALLENGKQDALTNDEMIALLVQAEWEDRENRKIGRYLKSAKFRYPASVEELDLTAQRGLDRTLMLRLADCTFVQRKENVLITGPTGAGKSYIASALGHQACMSGHRALYFNAQKMFPQLNMSKADGTYLKQLARIEKHELLIIDDFGLQPLDANSRMMLLEVLEDRHGVKSTIMASQLPVASWYDVIGDSTIADAILDRLLNSSHRIELKGESMRKVKVK
ncbi:IS21-like element helper ATPase IstB [Chondrinema litorale]|uniref:IS21-like element helper ATPase IstB n=1 Tax=Chondrinema litorale TaxID=2994555 RepID=UPI002543E07D|nr:IS21-like element helper ATPase IstB [Chondrinema litorale]UZR95971.1 IS21-like element helper ATPase IstB [Chondrinema litorale]UZR96320.1 IS21-like element helper ATPase IstB [Chondrinema litorale]UZR96808.1 IS21-like element helper ATPase IstB [Chondrinema litorale]